MKKIIYLSLLTIFLSPCLSAQDFGVSCEYFGFKATALNAQSNEQDMAAAVIKLYEKFEISDNLNVVAKIGYALNFEFIPFELGLALNLSDNLLLNIGGGLYQMTDERWVTSGLEGGSASDNEMGLYAGISYNFSKNLSLLLTFNSFEFPDSENPNSGLSLQGYSAGISYNFGSKF